jgi:hypothetical protein
MKRLLHLISCFICFNCHAQEKINTFHIVDNEGKTAVPSATITILKAKLSITTEADGIFIIPGDLSVMRDTVIVNAQNYQQLKIALNKLHGMDTLKLSKLENQPIMAIAILNQDTLLNNYKRKEIGYYAGISTKTAAFNYLQLAQQFDITKSGIKLTKVVVNRLAFNGFTTSSGYVDVEPTKFRIRIYDIDPVTNGPGRDLCNKIIEVNNTDSKQLGISLKKYNITIPNTTFFVAIEWMRDFTNIGYSMLYNEKHGKDEKHINYRPAIGISPIKGKKLNIWGLNFEHEWKLYTYFSPDWTDLAVKAVVEY